MRHTHYMFACLFLTFTQLSAWCQRITPNLVALGFNMTLLRRRPGGLEENEQEEEEQETQTEYEDESVRRQREKKKDNKEE